MNELGKIRTRGLKCLKQIRYELRTNMTRAEEVLWQELKKRKLGSLRFRRQHGIGPYVVDFYHAESMTIIEIDGPIHDRGDVMENDIWREGYFKQRGYKILRFKNEQVFNDLRSVLKFIQEATL